MLSSYCLFRVAGEAQIIKRKVQGVSQSQYTAKPCYQEEEKKDRYLRMKNKQCTRSTYTSSLFPKRGDHNAKQD